MIENNDNNATQNNLVNIFLNLHKVFVVILMHTVHQVLSVFFICHIVIYMIHLSWNTSCWAPSVFLFSYWNTHAYICVLSHGTGVTAFPLTEATKLAIAGKRYRVKKKLGKSIPRPLLLKRGTWKASDVWLWSCFILTAGNEMAAVLKHKWKIRHSDVT